MKPVADGSDRLITNIATLTLVSLPQTLWVTGKEQVF